MQLVKGRTADRAAAVVPEGHGDVVGGVVVIGKGQKVLQRARVAHVGGVLLLDEAQALAVIEPALELAGVHLVVLPLGRAAGLDDDVHILGQLYLQHLRQIGGGTAVVGLQVAAAEIPVDGPAAVSAVLCAGVAAAGGESQGHRQGQTQGKQSLLHFFSPPWLLRSRAAASSWRRTPPPSASPGPPGSYSAEFRSLRRRSPR